MTISLSSYSTGTVAVEQGSTTVVLSGAGAAWPESWCKPGCQFAIAGEAQTNYIAAWTDDHTVELALPVARATEADLTYSILITAPAFGTNLEAALTNIERIRLMSENAEIGDLLAIPENPAIWPAHDDLLAVWDKGDGFKAKPTTVSLLNRLLNGVIFKAGDYAVQAEDTGRLIAVSAGAAAVTINLPPADTIGGGFPILVKKIDTSANTVTIAAAVGNKIDGDASVVLASRYDVVALRSDGANWQIVGDLRRIAEGVRYDAAVETDADLIPYDDKPGPTATEPGFAVLIGNIGGTGRAGIKWKLSDNSADWSDPAYLAPTVDFTADPVDVVPFGTDPTAALTSDGAGNYVLKLSLPKAADLLDVIVDTLPPGSEATAALIPAAGGYGLALGIPQGATGTIDGLTAFWQNVVTTKEDAPTSRAALEVDAATPTALNDANDIDAVGDGWYRWVSVVPAHAPTGYATMLQRNDGGQPIQIVFGGLSPQSIFIRRKTAGVWETFTKVGATTPVQFHAYRSADATLTTGVRKNLACDVELFDVGGYYNAGTGRFTPPAGKYLLGAMAFLTSGVNAAGTGIELYKNGASTKYLGYARMSGTGDFAMIGSAIVEANGTDYFDWYIFQASGGNLTLGSRSDLTYIFGARLP